MHGKALLLALAPFLAATNVIAAEVNVPITETEYSALQADGLERRDNGPSLAKRDKINCGTIISAKGHSSNSVSINVNQFTKFAEQFCNTYVGTQINHGYKTLDTYTVPSCGCNVNFAMYNTQYPGPYTVDYNTCLNAMKGPLSSSKSVHKRDKNAVCIGPTINDYYGGYTQVNNIGAFGCELY